MVLLYARQLLRTIRRIDQRAGTEIMDPGMYGAALTIHDLLKQPSWK
jgi:hypothetical protein